MWYKQQGTAVGIQTLKPADTQCCILLNNIFNSTQFYVLTLKCVCVCVCVCTRAHKRTHKKIICWKYHKSSINILLLFHCIIRRNWTDICLTHSVMSQAAQQKALLLLAQPSINSITDKTINKRLCPHRRHYTETGRFSIRAICLFSTDSISIICCGMTGHVACSHQTTSLSADWSTAYKQTTKMTNGFQEAESFLGK